MCTDCTAGNACPSGAGEETACLAGFYSDAAATTCVACPAGKECTSLLASDVADCAAGTYSLGEAQSCSTCPAGE